MRNFVGGAAVMLPIVLALGSAYAVGRSSNEPAAQQPVALAPTATETPPTSTPIPPTATATAVPPSPPPEPPQPVVLADRTSCGEIRGSEYRSDAERTWFAANCATTSQPQTVNRNQNAVSTSSTGCYQNELTEQQVRARTEYPYFFELRSGGFALARRGTPTGTVLFYEPLQNGCFYLVETKQVLGLCDDGTWLVNDAQASLCAALSRISLWLSTRTQPGTVRAPALTATPVEQPFRPNERLIGIELDRIKEQQRNGDDN